MNTALMFDDIFARTHAIKTSRRSGGIYPLITKSRHYMKVRGHPYLITNTEKNILNYKI
jgi:hypothetical protein